MGHVGTEDALPLHPCGFVQPLNSQKKGLCCDAEEFETTALRRHISPTLQRNSFHAYLHREVPLFFDLASCHQKYRHRGTKEVMKCVPNLSKLEFDSTVGHFG